MVHEKFYEEKLDFDLLKLVPDDLQIEKCNAFPLTKPRLIGDIGLRAFFHLYKKAKEIIKKEAIDFLYIPIPSFYVALLGRWLHSSTGVAYGIDYIDPWVHTFQGSDQLFSRHWFSTKISSLLEPVAVKNAALITGVAAGYYEGVQQRNPKLLKQALFGAMPYGGEARDHQLLRTLNLQPYLFLKKNGKIQFVYAGAMLPNAYLPLEEMMKAISKNETLFSNIEFHFIGTGKKVTDQSGFNIRPYAEKYGLWQKTIFEYPARIPYLDVLIHLEAADAVFILGSTEPHYTPSKTYQAVLSGKPLFAVLHAQSTAVKVIDESVAGLVLPFSGENDVSKISELFSSKMEEFFFFLKNFKKENVRMEQFDQYSAKRVTASLAQLLDKTVCQKGMNEQN